jgi:photosystem II stability/assembly factor-like uncharacterized protein
MRSFAPAALLVLLPIICSRPAAAAGWAVGGNGLVIRSGDGGQSWSSSSPATGALNAVHFTSDDEGWAVGNGGIAIHTTDGGDHWTQSSPGTVNLNGVFFTDASHGWVVGDAGKILRTTYGGGMWSTSTPTSANLYGVFFLDDNYGWAVGKGVVLRTTNGGVTWTSGAPTTQTLRGIYFVSASVGFAVGTNGIVLKSTDGGYSWTASTETASDLYAVTFTSATSGWAVGEAGIILDTTDGGVNWNAQRAGSVILRSVSFVDTQSGWVAGQNGTVVQTADGGAHWDVTHPATVSLNGVFFASAPSGVAVTIDTQPDGLSYQVDGVDYTAAHTFRWEPGSPHTIATTSPQAGGAGTQYIWTDWSNGGAISQVVSPDANATYTASFTQQHYLTMPGAANGSTSPSSGWFDAGSSVQITATPDPGFGFNGWTGMGTGSYSGWANPANVQMNGPVTETPSFSANVSVIVKTSPAGRSFVVDGTTYTAQQTFTWAAGSAHTLDTLSPQTSGADTLLFVRWSDGGAQNHSVTPSANQTYIATFTTSGTASPAPAGLTLLQNAPNPASTHTDFRFGLARDSDVKVEVFDVAGHRVFEDVARGVPSGWQSYRLEIGEAVPPLKSGVYFLRITTASESRANRFVILR